MAVSYKILGSTDDASTEVTLYTVPPTTNVKAKITATNRGVAATFRSAAVAGGGVTANSDYIAYDEAINANKSLTSTTITLESGDVIRVTSSTADVTFIVFGIEQDTS